MSRMMSLTDSLFDRGIFPPETIAAPSRIAPIFKRSSEVSSVTGPDGRPVVKEVHRSTVGDGRGLIEERYEAHDAEKGFAESGLARSIGDKRVIVRKTQRLSDGNEETRTELKNVKEDELPQFDEQWQTAIKGSGAFDLQKQQQLLSMYKSGPAIEASTVPMSTLTQHSVAGRTIMGAPHTELRGEQRGAQQQQMVGAAHP